MNISKIDKNFSAIPADKDGFLYRDVRLAPFSLEGYAWFKENKESFYRLPKTVTTAEINEGAVNISNHTSGVCVRFRSDSSTVQIRAKLAYSYDMNLMPRTGSAGFDSYCRPEGGEFRYNHTIQPDRGQVDMLALIGKNPDQKMCDWIINFPLYGGVSEIEIGLKENSIILPPAPHRIADPILFYGSSITQGGCASRPGNQYPAMLCRKLDAPLIDLGFSGHAMGEIAIAKLIGALKLSMFVFDYDHNAPTPEHLEKTHEPFFKMVRQMQPELPILLLSRGDNNGEIVNEQRCEIIRNTYRHAKEAGDQHVYFIDGKTLFGTDMRDACTVDGCHPNDLGFYRMYEHILPTLEIALQKKGLL